VLGSLLHVETSRAISRKRESQSVTVPHFATFG